MNVFDRIVAPFNEAVDQGWLSKGQAAILVLEVMRAIDWVATPQPLELVGSRYNEEAILEMIEERLQE